MSEPVGTRIAVIRLDALGDTLLSTPAIDVLQREVGSENLLVFTSPGLGEVFGSAIPHHEVAPDVEEQEMADRIRDFGATSVFVFTEKKRALRAAHLSGVSQRVGFDPGWTQPLRSLEVKRYLTVRFPIVNSLDSHSRYHEVERYCRLVGIGLSRKFVNGGRLRFFSLDRETVEQTERLGFQVAKKWLEQGWPESLIPELVATLPTDTDLFVAPGEKDWAEKLLPESRRSALVSKSSLAEYAQAVGRCRYLISIDTGAVHVAAAMGVPVVDVFPEPGSHHTVPRWRPWMTPHQVVLKPDYEEGALKGLLDSVSSARQAMERVLDWGVARV